MTFDAATLVTSALQKLGTDASPDAIRAYVENLHAMLEQAASSISAAAISADSPGRLHHCYLDHAAKNWEAVSGLRHSDVLNRPSERERRRQPVSET